jgi:hypothetical protein
MSRRNIGKTREYSKAELRRIYAEARKEFTAADLQKYTVIEKGVPAEKVLAKLEAIRRRYSSKKS